MAHLLLLEMDGPDCIADHRHRLDAAKASGYPPSGPGSNEYWKIVNDPERMIQDTPVSGARELMEFLVRRKWRIILLTQRFRSHSIYAATTAWLEKHGFDPSCYELVMKEGQYSSTPIAEWKALKICMYGNETGYRRIVSVDPSRHCRKIVQQQWNALSGSELEVHEGVTPFCEHLSLYALRASLHPILEQHQVYNTDTEEEDVQSSILTTDPVRDIPQKESLPVVVQDGLVGQESSPVAPEPEAVSPLSVPEEPVDATEDDFFQSARPNDQPDADERNASFDDALSDAIDDLVNTEEEREYPPDDVLCDDGEDVVDDLLDDDEEELPLVAEHVGKRQPRPAQRDQKRIRRVDAEEKSAYEEASNKKKHRRDRSKERSLKVSIEYEV